jgi:putative ABC transport system substrate-binding protein
MMEAPMAVPITNYIRRRELIAFLGSMSVAWPLAASAQPAERMQRIAMLMSFSNDPEGPIRVAAFRQRLRELGWTDRYVQIDYRLADNVSVQRVASELIAAAPDVLLVNGTSVLKAVQTTTRTIPIVFVNVIDPVGQGFVQSLAHPGGNITGLSNVEFEMGGKWLQLLKQIAPQVTDVALVGATMLSGGAGIATAIQTAAPSFGMKIIPFTELRGASEIEYLINRLARRANTGLLVLPGGITRGLRDRLIVLAARGQLPAIYPYRYYVTSGGLMSYGVDTAEAYRRAAAYVDRILKGERPADIPVQQATKFELVINLKAARTLGLEVPSALLAMADQVIE